MDIYILRNVILNVCKGEILVIIGYVGSGKFFLLIVVFGELFVCEGIILYFGKVLYVL